MSAAASAVDPLDRYVGTFKHRLPPAETMPLAKIAMKVRERFEKIGSPAADSRGLEAAVRQATRNVDGLRSGQRLLLAFALAQPVAALQDRCLFDRESILDPLLRKWERDAPRGKLRLTHWKGLFHSYMQAPPGLAQQRLAKLLQTSFEPTVRARRRPPAWVDGFRRHAQLLTRNPCTPYLDDLVAGRNDRLNDLTEHLGVSIPPASWFWQQLKAEVLIRIERMGKAAFHDAISTFIGMDKSIPMATNDLVGALLNRYEACGDHAKHAALMDFAIDAWGSPQLDSNLDWLTCNKAAREMVCRWIAREDLEQFYRLCKEEREVDEARLEFWLRFQKQMAYTQILIGSGMRRSTEPAIRKFVRDRTHQGRLGNLLGGAANNALLMRIGKWVFVEFSQLGTACRCIRLTDSEFEAGQPSYTLSGLRGIGEKWIHTPSGAWQSKFLVELAAKGIQPDDEADATVSRPPRPRARTHARQQRAPELQELAAMGLRIRDHRDKGGALWVFAEDDARGAFRGRLAAMGFRYSKNKAGWYRP